MPCPADAACGDCGPGEYYDVIRSPDPGPPPLLDLERGLGGLAAPIAVQRACPDLHCCLRWSWPMTSLSDACPAASGIAEASQAPVHLVCIYHADQPATQVLAHAALALPFHCSKCLNASPCPPSTSKSLLRSCSALTRNPVQCPSSRQIPACLPHCQHPPTKMIGVTHFP